MIKKSFFLAIICSHSLFAGWSAPIEVYSGFSGSTLISGLAPVSAIDSAGNGVVAYYGQHFQDSLVGSAQIISGTVTNPISYPPLTTLVGSVNVVVNNSGNATVLWAEFDGNAGYLRSIELTNNVWSQASPNTNQITDPMTENVLFNSIPGLTRDSANQSIGLWARQNLNGDSGIGYNFLQSGSWTGEQTLVPYASDYLPVAYISGSPSGQAFALWSNSGPFILQGSYFNGSTWANNLSISTDLQQSCIPPMDVSMNSANNTLIAWANFASGGSAILCTQGTFGPVETIYEPVTDLVTQEIAVSFNATGDGAAAWITQNSNTSEYILNMAFRENGTWQAPLRLDANLDGILEVNIKLDGNGNAFVVWARFIGGDSSVVGSYVAAGSTIAPNYELISTDDTMTAIGPNLAVNELGQALVSWETGTNPSKIEAAIGSFSAPAQGLSGAQVKNQFATQYQRANVLTWSPSSSVGIEHYYVFRNGVQIGTLPGYALRYFDYNQSTTPTEYTVIAVNGQNVQSDPAFTTVP